VKDATARRLSRLHATIYRVTGGRVGKRLVRNDMLLLTTLGRTTGAPHTVPLLYLQDGTTLAVIASWGGRDHHPDWYRNLAAHPWAIVNIGGHESRVEAQTAHGEAREMWWRRALEAYHGYAVYQGRTEREIPIVMLEPAGVGPSAAE
jgi:deazaflavin-dependent oxidoreductase (nitroreductase family)